MEPEQSTFSEEHLDFRVGICVALTNYSTELKRSDPSADFARLATITDIYMRGASDALKLKGETVLSDDIRTIDIIELLRFFDDITRSNAEQQPDAPA